NQRFAGNRPNSILIADRLTPYSMGALLALYENKIAFQGFTWNINSFDQEGVQLGKILAGRLLEQLAAEKEGKTGPLAGESAELNLLRAAGGIG
ncbi:MAG TPA: glucose-6-phosphate isomerase, partial [Desulfobacteraceae bacterium]|nr:glucose-6-phosphate isomerase [Desulfobacteraceae bacterium]